MNLIRTAAISAVAIALTACATPAQVDSMTTNKSFIASASTSPLRGNIAIKDVIGGEETNPLWTSKISAADFERALEASLQGAGLLAARQSGKNVLSVHLQKLDQPLIGISFTVTATVNYRLTERATGKVLYEKDISVPYTATFGDAAMAITRLRLANEGAARTNIEAFIDEVLALRIGEVALN